MKKDDKCLKESGLPDKAVTDTFKKTLMDVKESKETVEGKEVVTSIEEGIKALIKDRKEILGITKDVKDMGHSEDDTKISEKDQDDFNKTFFGIEKEEKKEEKKD